MFSINARKLFADRTTKFEKAISLDRNICWVMIDFRWFYFFFHGENAEITLPAKCEWIFYHFPSDFRFPETDEEAKQKVKILLPGKWGLRWRIAILQLRFITEYGLKSYSRKNDTVLEKWAVQFKQHKKEPKKKRIKIFLIISHSSQNVHYQLAYRQFCWAHSFTINIIIDCALV